MSSSTVSLSYQSNLPYQTSFGAKLVLNASASEPVIPDAEDYHVQEYLSKRAALLAEEKMLRQGRMYSPYGTCY